MTGAATALSFFDPDRRLHGTLRSGAALLFEGTTPTALPEGTTFEHDGDRVRAELPERLSLEAEAVTEDMQLGGVSARVCRVTGHVGAHPVDCLGTVSETTRPPEWQELDAVRTISVLVDAENAFLAVARRPRGAVGHSAEHTVAWLIEEGRLLSVEEARLSTVYDGEGRQRSAGLELWLPGEELPRRGSGSAVAGSSLDLEAVRVQAAVFAWNLEGHDAIGAYELMIRAEQPAAA